MSVRLSVTKFEMAEATLVKTFLAAQKDLHFIKFRPPFSTVGSFSEVRFRGSHFEAWSNATSVDVSKKLVFVFENGGAIMVYSNDMVVCDKYEVEQG